MKNLKLTQLTILMCALLAVSCSKSSLEPDPDPQPQPERPETPVEGRVVAAYVTYYGSTLPDPEYVTHIMYAFAELYVENGVYKGFKIKGNESRLQSVLNLKQRNPKLKILLSFSHTVSNPDNSQGGGFSALAKSAEYRKAFAEDVLEFLKTKGMDGVDIDWEFPGISWSGHACDPAVDVANHVLLLKELRETLGSARLITYAGYVFDKQASTSSTGGWKFIDIAAVDPYVDFVNIMTYDMDADGKPHNALNNPSAYRDCKRAVQSYLNAGVSPRKLVLGIPFYGRRSFSGTNSAISYKEIIKLGSEYVTELWDEKSSVPYVIESKTGKYYCSYDNPKSIGIKGKWALSLGMRGMMYWETGQDDSNRTLAKAVWNSTMTK